MADALIQNYPFEGFSKKNGKMGFGLLRKSSDNRGCFEFVKSTLPLRDRDGEQRESDLLEGLSTRTSSNHLGNC